MISTAPALRLSPELRAAAYHFTVFGTAGVASVYFGIWLTHRGIEPGEIGILNAAPVFLMMAVNLFVGRIADKAKDWRGVIIVLSLISAAAAFGLFFVSGFWAILGVWVLTSMPAAALVPVIDAATFRMAERRGSSFSVIRAWGTVGFMATTAVAGPAIGFLGEHAFVPLFVGFALSRALLSLQLPQFRGGDEPATVLKPSIGVGKLRQVMKPWFIAALAGVALLYASHGAIGAFGALLWTRQGVPEGLIGMLIAVMAASEAAMMFLWPRLKLKISARHIIIFACVVAALRWTVMAFSPPIWLLFLLQGLHAITFAMGYLGGIYFIANWTKESIAAEAQGFSYVLQQAASVVMLVSLGWCIDSFGAMAMLLVAGLCVIGAGMLVLSLRLQPAHSHAGSADAPQSQAKSGLDQTMP
jgi:MFS transporter, PPP family, 3-phenylpropionic acid transporter